jgi:hypothetical protein
VFLLALLFQGIHLSFFSASFHLKEARRHLMKKLTFVLMLFTVVSIAIFGSISAFAASKSPQPRTAVLRWTADPVTEGLNAFEGVEDDPSHSEPGVKHIFVVGNTYRFNMDTRQREAPGDRQRNEVKGMVSGGQILTIGLGETWRFTYSMFIPMTLRGTTSFTHIFQLKRPGLGTAPLVTLDLRRVGNQQVIALNAFTSGADVASTNLFPLQGHWIDTVIEVTAGPQGKGRLHWTLIDGGKTIVNAERDGVDTWLGDRLRPKWGIYRSINDKVDLLTTYLLLRNMRAYQIV